MKTVTYGWLMKQNPSPSLAWSSNKYQYYYCPTNAEYPYASDAIIVKIKKSHVIHKLEKEKDNENQSLPNEITM